MLARLHDQKAQLTGEGEDLDISTKSYRQSIFKLNHKMNKLRRSQARILPLFTSGAT